MGQTDYKIDPEMQKTKSSQNNSEDKPSGKTGTTW